MLKLIARFISIIFSPPLVMPLTFYLVLSSKHVSPGQFKTDFYLILLVEIIILGIFLYLKHLGLISDWSIKNRNERHQINVISLLVLGLFYMTAKNLLSFFVVQILILIFIELVVFSIITWFWKISGHQAAVMISALLLFQSTYNSFWVSIGFIAINVLVGWSRVWLKRHTLYQVIAGGLLSLMIFRVGLVLGLV